MEGERKKEEERQALRFVNGRHRAKRGGLPNNCALYLNSLFIYLQKIFLKKVSYD